MDDVPISWATATSQNLPDEVLVASTERRLTAIPSHGIQHQRTVWRMRQHQALETALTNLIRAQEAGAPKLCLRGTGIRSTRNSLIADARSN
jgi:hypothetical protein